MALVFSSILLTERRYQHPTSDFMLFWATPGLNSQVVPVTRQEFCPLNSIVTPFYLVPDEDRGWDSDDLTAQVHLGASDIPDVLGGVTMEGPCSQVPLLTWVTAFSPRLSARRLAARSWQPLG